MLREVYSVQANHCILHRLELLNGLSSEFITVSLGVDKLEDAHYKVCFRGVIVLWVITAI